jgi:TatA/E family protein of Tat protein translocase
MLRAATMHAPVTSTSFSSRRCCCSTTQSSSAFLPGARTQFSIGKNRSNYRKNNNNNNNNKRGSLQVSASIFGVGAPEALVIGVVALVVFGPKGLADLAKGLGETLRAFKPTIQELQQVSQEFQETLSNEVGIDDITKPLAPQKRVTPPPIREVNVEEEERIKEMNASVQFEMTEQAKASQAMAEGAMNDVVSEDMIEASKRAAWGGTVPGELSSEEPAQVVAEVAEAPAEEPVMRVMDYTQPAAPSEEEKSE